MSETSEDLAQEAMRLAVADPSRSVALAERASQMARAANDLATVSVAERAWGLAAYYLKDTGLAVRHLKQAVRFGQLAQSPQLAAEARMTLAGVLGSRGQSRAALREVEAALAGLTGLPRARALVQRATIFGQLGRFDAAMDSYREALPSLRRADDLVWVQRALQNMSIVRGYRGEFAAAEADLREAERVCQGLGLDLHLGLIHQNLAFINARRGDVPIAMDHLHKGETLFRTLDSELGKIIADRARVLLSVRLLSEARQAANEAVCAFEREGRGLDLPEARLLLAQAALLDGDLASAACQAGQAVREFTRYHSPDWIALARLVLIECRVRDARQRHRVRIRHLEQTADLLATTWPAAALDARLTAATLAIERGQHRRGRELLELASQGRRRGVATLRARAWYAEAQLRQVRGNRRGARGAARAGLRILDEHVAGLGATDLRAHAAGHRIELAELGLRTAIEDRRPERVLEWAERGRASHLAYPPARPPNDPELAKARAELRTITTEIDNLRGRGVGSTRLLQRQMALERQVRDHHRRQRGGRATAPPPPTIHALAEKLGDAALLEFIQLDSTLHVLSIVAGRARLHTLGGLAELAGPADILPFGLRRLTRRTITSRSRQAAQSLLRDTAAQLDTALLQAVPEIGDRPLVIIPTGQLQSLPWSILPSCHGRAVTVAPSATLWWTATRRPYADGRVAVAAGPDLAGAHDEAAAIAAIHRTTALTGPAATVSAVTSALDGAALAHLATHGQISIDNPLFSALRFADGRLMVYDLEAINRAPHTVVLAACDSGRPVVRSGDELLGLGATLLAQGATQLIAPVLSVLDIETAPLMIALHERLVAGQAAADALANAQQEVAGQCSNGLADVAPFVCLGAGFTAPDPSPPELAVASAAHG